MKRIISISLTIFILGLSTHAQDKWDVTDPGQPYKEVNISVDEGTWLNVDVSPDGEQIVFDLLGDIFIMPVAGGQATKNSLKSTCIILLIHRI